MPASTAPQCAPSARLAWGREGRGGERKRGVGHPLYSVPVLFGFPSSDGAFLALAAPGRVWRWLGGRGCACACLCVWSARWFLGVQALLLVGSCLQEGSEWIPPRGASSPPQCRWRRSSPAAGLFRRSAASFPSGPLSNHQPPPGAHLPPSQLCVATRSCFGRAVVAVLCRTVARKARLPCLAACSQPQPPRAAGPPARPSTLPALWAPGCVTGSVGSRHPACTCDPARICPPAAKFENLWGFQGGDFLRSSPWRDAACGKLPAE